MNYRGQKVLIVGLGESGKAACRFFAARGARVAATDRRKAREIGAVDELRRLGVELHLGGHPEELFLTSSLIVPSPGVPWDLPLLAAAREAGAAVHGELEIAAPLLRGRNIGVTGTNGKTTVTSLISHILREDGRRALTAGNIGTPLLAVTDQSRDDGWNVLELSSFQLEASSSLRCHIAVVLNVTPDHLDRHGSMEAYLAAKMRILLAQRDDDTVVLNAGDPYAAHFAAGARGGVTWFRRGQPLSSGASVIGGRMCWDGKPFSDTRLRIVGAHNLENALAAAAACRRAGVSLDAIERALHSFQPVAHRLEFVRRLRGVDYYNDSKATNVDAAIKALEAFEGRLWVILGGLDKGSDYCSLAPLLREKARAVFLIGSAAEKIAAQLGSAVDLRPCGALDAAVREAYRASQPGDTVLLAPACASFDQFADYRERGETFKRLVAALPAPAESATAADETHSGGNRAKNAAI